MNNKIIDLEQAQNNKIAAIERKYSELELNTF